MQAIGAVADRDLPPSVAQSEPLSRAGRASSGTPDADVKVAVWYPSRAAFLQLEEYPGFRLAFEVHRRAAIEPAMLLLCDGGAQPLLSSPYG